MYVDNADLQREMAEWKTLYNEAMDKGDPSPRVSELLGGYILDIATNYAKKHQFRGYSFIDDMIADGVYEAIRGLKGFKPETVLKTGNSPAFYFITLKVHQAFIRRIPLEKKQQEIKTKSLILHHTADSVVGDVNDGHFTIAGMDDQPTEFLQSIFDDHCARNAEYEQKLDEKKALAKAKADLRKAKSPEKYRKVKDDRVDPLF